MTKQVNIVPNLRVDIPDFKAQGQEFSTELFKLQLERWVQRHYSVIMEGFRVEIPDQTANPGLFTVVNGLAFNRSGQLVNNEDELNAKRSFVLTANSTFYVEIEFITDFTDTDARAFWDSTFDNAADPSGDARPDGREFSQNIATRIAADWSIVQPVSTTGFDRITSPNSLRIPVAVLTVVAGEIDGGATTPARTNLAEAISGGATSVRGLDTRHMPNSFTLRLDPGGGGAETVVVSANDRENGILTCGPTAGPHAVGTRLADEDVTPTQLLDERTLPPLPTSGTEDARPRFFQGDEERGYALTQDPYAAAPNKSDLEIKTLKDMVDALAAEIREMKFGSSRAADVGDIAPPLAFAAVPRWYDRAGGLQGSRTNTVSVGNGVTTFGDFNTTTSGSPVAALQAAHDALTAGGIMFVKRGTYAIGATPWAITKNITVLGEGKGQTIIEATDGAGAVAITVDADDCRFERVAVIINGGTATHALSVIAAQVWTGGATDCTFHGITTLTGQISASVFENCLFEAQDVTPGTAFAGNINTSKFRDCTFQSLFDGVAARTLSITTGPGNEFAGCSFVSNPNALTLQTVSISLGTASRTRFSTCIWSQVGGSVVAFDSTVALSDLKIDSSDFQLEGGLGVFDEINGLWLTNCTIEADDNAVVLDILSTANDSKNIWITNCKFSHDEAVENQTGIAIRMDDVENIHITDSQLFNFSTGLSLGFAVNVTVQGCSFGDRSGAPNQTIIYGIRCPAGIWDKVRITECHFENVSDATFTGNAGAIYMEGTRANHCHIANCEFQTTGSPTWTEAYAIYFTELNLSRITGISVQLVFGGFGVGDVNAGIRLVTADQVTISECDMTAIGGLSTGEWYGIKIDELSQVSIINNQLNSMGNAASTLSVGPGDMPAAISCGTDAEGSVLRLVISGNTIRAMLHGTANHFGIQVGSGCAWITISNNVINVSDDDFIGIAVQSKSGGSVRIGNVNITGNIVNGSMEKGIHIECNIGTERGFNISNNTILDFDFQAIMVQSLTGTMFEVTISNNVCRTAEVLNDGILLSDVENFLVNGNIVVMEGADTTEPIVIFDATTGAVNNNVIAADHSSAQAGECIDMEGGTILNVVCVGNMINCNKSAGGAGISVGDWMYVAANFVTNNASGGTAIDESASNTFHKAHADSDETTFTDPGSLPDVGLNRRIIVS